MIMHYSCIRTFFSFSFVLYLLIGAFLFLSLSLSLSDSLRMAPNANLLHPKTLFVPGHHLLPSLLHSMSGSLMRRPVRTSRRTSPNVAFIRNAMLSYRTSPIALYPLSFTVGVGNLFVRSQRVVLP